MDIASTDLRYWAFVSYSHTDERWSRWLHRKLETYRVPRRLVGRQTERGPAVPRRVIPIFRDREELPSSADLGENIETALRQSRYLIVLCSPRSAVSRWVNQEIKTFKALGGEDRVLALILEGEPNAADHPSAGLLEAFPEALRYRVRRDGSVSAERVEPIAADVRPGRDGRRNALLKILAGVLGVGYDELKRRERARRVRRRIALTALAASLAASAAGGWQWQEARRARALRVEQSRSDFLEGVTRLERGDLRVGPLYLARALRADPANAPAALRIADLLQRRRFAHPRGTVMSHAEEVLAAEFSGDGSLIATGSHDGTARVWHGVTGRPVTPSLAHATTVHGVAFSPDGTKLLTVSGWHFDPGTVMVWDIARGTPVGSPLEHREFVFNAVFNPAGDRIVSASADRTARVWDAASGRPVLPPLMHPDYVGAARFSPDGRFIATGCNDGRVRLWSASTGALRLTTPSHDSQLRDVWFNTDGSQMLARTDQTIRGWSTDTGEEQLFPISDAMGVFRLPGDRAAVAIVASDGLIRLRDVRTGVPLGPELGQGEAVKGADLSPDGLRLAIAADSLVRVWEVPSGRLLAEPINVDGVVSTVRWSPDGRGLLVASGARNRGGWSRVWVVPVPGEEAPRSIEGGGYLARFRADGLVIATAHEAQGEGAVTVWSLPGLTRTAGPFRFGGPVQSVELDSAGRRLLVAVGSCGRAGAVHVVEASSGAPSFPPIQHLRGAVSARWSPDGSRMVSASCGRTVRVWDATTGAAVTEYLDHGDRVNSLDWSPDGATVLTASGAPVSGPVADVVQRLRNGDAELLRRLKGAATGQVPAEEVFRDPTGQAAESPVDAVWIWNAASGAVVLGPVMFTNSVHLARFSPDGRQVAVAVGSQFRGGSAFARVLDARSGQAVTGEMPLEGSADWVEWSRDGTRLVTAHSPRGFRGVAQVWDARSGGPVSTAMVHRGTIRVARFSPDGRWVFTASADSTARLWDSRSGRPVTEPWQHDGPVEYAEFSPDGTLVVTTTGGHRVTIREVPLRTRGTSYLELATALEAVLGSRLSDAGTIAPARGTIAEVLAAHPVLRSVLPSRYVR
ncbi:MAG: toll/interleukin-1 receptor domain-containing protein [Gemmatimonadales bacterium]